MRDQQPPDGPNGSQRPAAAHLTRRSVLSRALGGALALSGGDSLLAASRALAATVNGAATGVGGIPIATKTHPVKLPIYSDNRPIPSGRKPEKGPLVVFDWGSYLSNSVVTSFEKQYGVSVQVTTFSSIDEAVKKIASGAIAADVWVPVVEELPNYVAAKLVQPINHSYIPNLANALPSFQSPWYDAEAQYSIPNYVWTTGIAWRNDLLKIDPASMKNPWDVFWTVSGANGKIGLQNADPFDPLSLALLKRGITNFSAATTAQINQAVSDLKQLTGKGAKLQYTAFQQLGTGTEVLAQAWNGDVLLVPQYLPSHKPVTNISYWFPPSGEGSVNSDYWTIPKNAKHPVLAHLWMNHFLQQQNAIDNYKDAGYQQPLSTLSLLALKAAKVADPYILDLVWVTPTEAAKGLPNPIPTTQQAQLFQSAFAELSSGA